MGCCEGGRKYSCPFSRVYVRRASNVCLSLQGMSSEITEKKNRCFLKKNKPNLA